MPVTILIGAQWGDEGKGRVADWLAQNVQAMARYAGGDNAGHTVQVGAQEFKLHLVPSGIVHPHVRCLLGSGMVINPVRLLREINELQAQGVTVTPDRLHISPRAHIITPAHLMLDGASERARGGSAIGTTRRGIGPAYQDKAARTGLLADDMRDTDRFATAVQGTVERANKILTAQYGQEPIRTADLALEYGEAAAQLAPFLADTNAIVHDVLARGDRLLCEGAQGTLLDIDHGHYPYVTSSSATVGGALTGLGFGPQAVDRVVGVAKVYCTRVGNGPFPTELADQSGERLREAGHEYGTTTGRPRRCGWLDVPALRYAIRINGFTELVLTKLDVLSGFERLPVAVAYEVNGQRVTVMPQDAGAVERAVPVYEELPGWSEDVSDVRHWEDLPPNARRYVTRIADLTGLPISMVSLGPEREQLVSAAESD